MTKFLVSFIVIITSVCSFSQSGYMGKTVYIDYNAGVSLTPNQPTYSRPGDQYTPSSYYGLTHEVSIHKIITRKHEIAPFFNFQRTSFYYDNDEYYYDDFNYRDLSNKVFTYNYGVNFRFYFRSKSSWNVAPVGNYFDLKPYASNLKLVKEPTFGSGDGVVTYNAIIPALGLGFGRQRVIRNVITFNYGMQINLPFVMFHKTTNTYVNSGVERDLLKGIFQVKIGIGLLAF